jgi:hypothetical protein
MPPVTAEVWPSPAWASSAVEMPAHRVRGSWVELASHMVPIVLATSGNSWAALCHEVKALASTEGGERVLKWVGLLFVLYHSRSAIPVLATAGGRLFECMVNIAVPWFEWLFQALPEPQMQPQVAQPQMQAQKLEQLDGAPAPEVVQEQLEGAQAPEAPAVVQEQPEGAPAPEVVQEQPEGAPAPEVVEQPDGAPAPAVVQEQPASAPAPEVVEQPDAVAEEYVVPDQDVAGEGAMDVDPGAVAAAAAAPVAAMDVDPGAAAATSRKRKEAQERRTTRSATKRLAEQSAPAAAAGR